ncbi:MAG: L-histidine N(alpha)-methyltransferase [Candidatus Nanopelagicales bacterium]
MTDDALLPPSPLTWAYVDDWAEEEPALAKPRKIAAKLGVPVVSRAAGSALRFLAATGGAKAIVEVGSGVGVSGAWLLQGMSETGILTTVDADSELLTATRDTLAQIGYPHTRVRAIAGDPYAVLPRLSDASYDAVVIGPGIPLTRGEEHDLLREARRLLRPGGMFIVTHALGEDGADADHRDLAMHLRDDPDWIPALLTVGEGILVAVLAAAPANDAE